MAQKTPIVLSDNRTQHVPLAADDTVRVSDIPISPDGGNQIQARDNGLYYGNVSPADISNLYVSTTKGSDNNAGTRDAPFKTVSKAAEIVAARGVSGTYTIHLRAGETFPVGESPWFGHGTVSIVFVYYDDPTFGDLRATNGWYPTADARLKRPVLVFDTYKDSAGIIQAGGITAGTPQQITFEGVSTTFQNSAGGTTGGGWFLYWSKLDFQGSTITSSGNYQGIGSATNILLRQCNLDKTGSAQLFIADYSPQLFTQELVEVGKTKSDPAGKGPDVVGMPHNFDKQLKASETMALASYDSTTKTFFGWNANWDIFANG